MNTQMLNATGKRIAEHLKAHLESGKDYSPRSFYGEAFTLALLFRYQLLNEKLKTKLFNLIEQKNKDDPEYHFEFVNFALLDYQKQSGDQSFSKFLNPLRFKNTSCTNWTLLRAVSKCRAGVMTEQDWNEVTHKIKKYQQVSGFILDDKGVRSFQYHCFSACLIWELTQFSKNDFFKNAFLKAVSFIRHFILPNGETLHFGRGQHQSFGQGCLLALLSFAYTYDKNPELLAEIKSIHTYLCTFEREPGVFPLVMNQIHQPLPQKTDFMMDENYAGWYPYNNHFDYLPFFAYYIQRAGEVLTQIENEQWEEANRGLVTSYQDKDFLLVSLTRYIALVARSGGYWSNEQGLPLIYFKKQVRTPCLGGECFQKSLYSEEQLGLPYHPKYDKSLRWRALSFWLGNHLFIISPLGFLKRSFHFSENRMTMSEFFLSPFSGWRHMRSFFMSIQRLDNKTLRENGVTIRSSEALLEASDGLCAKGKLKTFWSSKAAELSWEFD